LRASFRFAVGIEGDFMTGRIWGMAAAFCALLCVRGAAQAEQTLGEALTHGKPIVELLVGFDVGDDKSFSACYGRVAEADTSRLRLGYETAKWHQLSLLGEISTTLAMGRYNDTRNGKTSYPTIADPHDIFLNRLQFNYKLGTTAFVVGRQRINIGNQRF